MRSLAGSFCEISPFQVCGSALRQKSGRFVKMGDVEKGGMKGEEGAKNKLERQETDTSAEVANNQIYQYQFFWISHTSPQIFLYYLCHILECTEVTKITTFPNLRVHLHRRLRALPRCCWPTTGSWRRGSWRTSPPSSTPTRPGSGRAPSILRWELPALEKKDADGHETKEGIVSGICRLNMRLTHEKFKAI